MLRVLGRVTSINVRKVLWCLDELGRPYEREDWGLPLRDPNAADFVALNPNAQVPVIVEDGFVLWESGAILRHLAEGTALWPAEARARAIADQWLTWQATELNAQWRPAFFGLIRKMAGFDDPVLIAQSIERWGRRMQMLDERLGQAPFAGGEAFTIADIALGLSAHRWYALPGEVPEFPQVRAYYERLLERPAGARYMAAQFN